MLSSIESTTAAVEAPVKLGTFKGVFLPNMLQMIGVILFLRLGWILGHVGLTSMAIIITISSGILLLTSLSMTTIVSNMKVGSGGAYFIISRLLGVEFGGAVGILLSLSQISGIVLNITGLSLSIQELFPALSFPWIQTIGLTLLTLISYSSTSLVVRTQTVILIILALSVGSIFLGNGSQIELPTTPTLPALSFWAGFALLFPGVTGIEMGMSMSGDLKNPNRSLPIGTIATVLIAFALYLSLSFFLSRIATPELLRAHPFILHQVSKFSPLVLCGLWGVTISNTLAGLMGSPRVLQALAQDQVLPSFLKKGHGSSNEPRMATLFVFAASLGVALLTNIDQIIPFLAMITLITYGLINFVAFVESFIKNPSWRPGFSVHWFIPLVGASFCLMAMLLINPIAAVCMFGVTALLCLWASGRQLSGNWDDIRYSLFSFIAQKTMAKLSTLPPNPKSWRPNILTVFDACTLEKGLAYFSHFLDQGMGFLTFGAHAQPSAIGVEENLQKTLDSYSIPAYIHINRFREDLKQMVENYGFGPLKPNTIILSLHQVEERFDYFSTLLCDIQRYKKNIILFKDDNAQFADNHNPHKKIHLWWRGGNQKNFELCLALSYLITGNPAWNNATICIKSIVSDNDRSQKLAHVFQRYKKRLRIKNLDFQTILDPEEAFFRNMVEHSKEADFTFLGLRECPANASHEDYGRYLKAMIDNTREIPQLAFALAGEHLDFQKIFN